MREIKFRGRDEQGRWHFGMLRVWRDQSFAIETTQGLAVDFVDPDTVGQFTGLRDAEGREIYEGDIVRVVHYGEESIHVIKYCDDMDYPAFDLWPNFDCECNGISFCKCENETTITVIGNIYDNPDLLEVAHD